MNPLWYFGFFLLSGFCSLVYETIWLRLAMAKFGVTTPMVSIALSVFMAGLALGSWAGGILARRLERSGPAVPLRLYGLAELIIGISGLLVPVLINFGNNALLMGRNQPIWDSSHYYLAAGAWVTLSLLPWCTCMGATFPLGMAAIRKTAAGDSQHSFSYLYLSNVLGAILGTIVPTFFLIEILGFRGTLRVASSLNAVLAITVFAVSMSGFPLVRTAVLTQEESVPARRDHLPGGNTFWLLFTTGICSMALEVVWIRLYTIYLGNVVYSFAVILALYLCATYTGSQAYRFWVRSHDPRQSGKLWIVLGLLAILPLVFADPSLPFPRTWWWSVFRAAMGVVPFSAALGFLTPMLVDHFSHGDPDRAGRAYSVNVLGSIVGPLLAGFLILPWLGEHWGIVALSLPLFSAGLLAAFRPAEGQAVGRIAVQKVFYAGTVLLSVPLIAMTHGYQVVFGPGVELRDYTATVIATGGGGNKRLLVNGIGMTSLTPVTKFMTHLPLALLKNPPQYGLVICFGMGTTFRSMLSWGIDSTAVDLVPSVPKLFGYYHHDGPELLRSPAAHVVIDDGRRFLERTAEKYDVITLDPPPPVSAPTSSLLFSREFYAIAKRHLRPGGIVQAWVYVDGSRWDLTFPAAAAKALIESFPYVRAFESVEGSGFHFLASDEPIPAMDARTLASRLPSKAAADFVEWGPFPTAEEMFTKVLEKEVLIDSIVAANPRVPSIQDDQPINEYFFLRIFDYYR